MIRRALVVAGLTLAGCAHEQPPRPEYVAENQPTFEAFRGKPVSVEVLDRAGLFSQSPGLITAAKQAIERQLTAHDVTVADASERRLVFEVVKYDGTGSVDEGVRQCLTVIGTVQTASQAFLPTAESRAGRCAGQGVGSGPADPISAVLVAAMMGVEAMKQEPGWKRDQAQALSHALSDVLAQMDAKSRYGGHQ